jgi:hypothetical protein
MVSHTCIAGHLVALPLMLLVLVLVLIMLRCHQRSLNPPTPQRGILPLTSKQIGLLLQ